MPSTRLDRAAYGAQDTLHFTSVPAAVWSTLVPVHGQPGLALVGAGALTVAGVYDLVIPTEGLADLEIHLMPSAVTGAISPVIETLNANGRRAKAVASTAAFAAGVLQSISIPDLLGVKAVRVRITVVGGDSLTFAAGSNPEAPTAVAEYNGA